MAEADEASRCQVLGCRDSEGKPRLLEDDRYVGCERCRRQAERGMRQIEARYGQMRYALRPGVKGGEPVSGPGFGSRAPLNGAVLAAMSEVTTWLAVREADVRERLALPYLPMHGLREPVLVHRAAVTIIRQWDRVAKHEELLLPIAHGVAYWQRRTDRLLGWDHLRHRLPAPCPYCETMTLVRDDGDDQVWCRACHRSWIENDYRRLVRILADELRRGG